MATLTWQVVPAPSQGVISTVSITTDYNYTGNQQTQVPGSSTETATFSNLTYRTVYDFLISIPLASGCNPNVATYSGSFFTGSAQGAAQMCTISSLSLSDFQYFVSGDDSSVILEWYISPAYVLTGQGTHYTPSGFQPSQQLVLSYNGTAFRWVTPNELPTGESVVTLTGLYPGSVYTFVVNAWASCYNSATWPTAHSSWGSGFGGPGSPPPGSTWMYMLVNGTALRYTWTSPQDTTGDGTSTGDPVYGASIMMYNELPIYTQILVGSALTPVNGSYWWKFIGSTSLLMTSGGYYQTCAMAPGFQSVMTSSNWNPTQFVCQDQTLTQGRGNWAINTPMTFQQSSGTGPVATGVAPYWNINMCYGANTCPGVPTFSTNVVSPTTVSTKNLVGATGTVYSSYPSGVRMPPGCAGGNASCPVVGLSGTYGSVTNGHPMSASVKLATVSWWGGTTGAVQYAGIPLSAPTELDYYVYSNTVTGFGGCLPVAVDLQFTDGTYMSQLVVSSPVPGGGTAHIESQDTKQITAADQCIPYSGPVSYGPNTTQVGWVPVSVDLTGVTDKTIQAVYLDYYNTNMIGTGPGSFSAYFSDIRLQQDSAPSTVSDGSFSDGLTGWFQVGTLAPTWTTQHAPNGYGGPISGDTSEVIGEALLGTGSTSPHQYGDSGLLQVLRIPDGLSLYGTSGGISLCYQYYTYTTDPAGHPTLDYQRILLFDFATDHTTYLLGSASQGATSTGVWSMSICTDVSSMEGDMVGLELIVHQDQSLSQGNGNYNIARFTSVALLPNSLVTDGEYGAVNPSMPLEFAGANPATTYGYGFINIPVLSAYSTYPGRPYLFPYSMANRTMDSYGDTLTAGLNIESFTPGCANTLYCSTTNNILTMGATATAVVGSGYATGLPNTQYIGGLPCNYEMLYQVGRNYPGQYVTCDFVQDISYGIGYYCYTINVCYGVTNFVGSTLSAMSSGGFVPGGPFVNANSGSTNWGLVLDSGLTAVGVGVLVGGLIAGGILVPETFVVDWPELLLATGEFSADAAGFYQDLTNNVPSTPVGCTGPYSTQCPAFEFLAGSSGSGATGGPLIGGASMSAQLSLYPGNASVPTGTYLIVVFAQADIMSLTMNGGYVAAQAVGQLNDAFATVLSAPG